VYLASKSPQRKALLEALGLDFEIVLPDYDEVDEAGLLPAQLVEQHSRGKALSVAARVAPLMPGRPVLGVDTLVYAGGRALGKAHDEATAREYLRCMSGQVHVVYSGITLVSALPQGHAEHEELYNLTGEIETVAGQEVVIDTRHATTDVRFARIDDAEIDAYIATGEWRERAGAYAIQGRASAFVEEVAGDYTNVVGLPVPLMVEMLRETGLWPPREWGSTQDCLFRY